MPGKKLTDEEKEELLSQYQGSQEFQAIKDF